MKKGRILIVENSVHVTGALKSVTRTAFDLHEYFDFVFVIPTNSKGRSWIESKGFSTIYELPMSELSKRVIPLIKYVPRLFYNSRQLLKIVKDERINLIHNNDLYNLLPVGLHIMGCKTPYITHIRFLPEKFPAILFKSWVWLHLRLSEHLIAVSQYLKLQLPDHSKISVIHNELPVEEKYPKVLNRSDAPVLLYLSNIIPGKGHKFAIEAFAKLATNFPPWRIRFVGGDMGMQKNRDYLAELKSLVGKLGLESRVDWAPFVEDVEKEYKKSDIVLNFSESESFSITCLEALYYGRPVIATDSGGPSEIIDHNETGLLVRNRDVKQMVDALDRLMSDSDLRKTLADNARKSVRIKFSVENTSLRLKSVYDTILNKNAISKSNFLK